MSLSPQVDPGSFRDPAGRVFLSKDKVYRQVYDCYANQYSSLKKSGFLTHLQREKLLIAHQEVTNPLNEPAFKTLEAEKIPFISYPYEWSFSQLKDAALLTLHIQKEALKAGFSLKDASAFNVQFYQGQPIFIDLLSFDQYSDGKPWIAYRQFCQHFLAPLALMSSRGLEWGQLSRLYLDGLPLPQVATLLPWSRRLNPGLFSHIYLHSLSQKSHQKNSTATQKYTLSANALQGLLTNLEQTLKNLQPPAKESHWSTYYQDNNYTPTAFKHKEQIVQRFLKKINPKSLVDLGANLGQFSRLAHCPLILSIDSDPLAVEYNYCQSKKQQETLLPLVIDLMNPSPGLGWDHQERSPFWQRCQVECTLALALVHHLVITQSVPFSTIFSSFAKISPHLLIEFVPANDSQARRLLQQREEDLPDYTQAEFEKAAKRYYSIEEALPLPESERILYLLKRKEADV